MADLTQSRFPQSLSLNAQLQTQLLLNCKLGAYTAVLACSTECSTVHQATIPSGLELQLCYDPVKLSPPCECNEMAFPLSLLKSFSPTTPRTTTTMGAKGPPAPLLPIRTTCRLGAPANTKSTAARMRLPCRYNTAVPCETDERITAAGFTSQSKQKAGRSQGKQSFGWCLVGAVTSRSPRPTADFSATQTQNQPAKLT